MTAQKIYLFVIFIKSITSLQKGGPMKIIFSLFFFFVLIPTTYSQNSSNRDCASEYRECAAECAIEEPGSHGYNYGILNNIIYYESCRALWFRSAENRRQSDRFWGENDNWCREDELSSPPVQDFQFCYWYDPCHADMISRCYSDVCDRERRECEESNNQNNNSTGSGGSGGGSSASNGNGGVSTGGNLNQLTGNFGNPPRGPAGGGCPTASPLTGDDAAAEDWSSDDGEEAGPEPLQNSLNGFMC